MIYPIIEEALLRYSQLVFHAQKYKYEDPARISAFLDTLITETLQGPGGSNRGKQWGAWSVDSGTSFSAWCTDHQVTFRSLPMLS